MDSVMNAAVEEICCGIEGGLTLAGLWSKLEASPSLSSSYIHLNRTVKTAIWTNILRIPTLRFEPRPSSSELEDAERLNLKISAQQSLADNFLGLYDSQSLQNAQMRVLHLLGNARANGITQSQLAKQLHIDANNFHYVLRSLECQGLIVKYSAIEKKKQISSHGESKNYPCVTTLLVYLRRYAKQRASHHRFEFKITKFNSPDDDDEDADGSTPKTDVHLKDYKPQMKAICDKLAKANGKVLLISDIKKGLGYCGSRPDGIVEQFDAKVNGKDDILHHMHVLNPQNCRTLLELMVLDKHLIVRKMHQNIFDGGPSLQDLIGRKSSQPKLICREHFFANPISTSLL